MRIFLLVALLWLATANAFGQGISVRADRPIVVAATLNVDTVALTFANSNNISDVGARNDLVGFVNELKASNIFTNMVDALILKPRFNATNQLSLLLHPFAVSNLTFTSWGAYFGGTNRITLPLAQSVTTNTLVFVFRSRFDLSTAQWLVGLVNTNTQSAVWIHQAGSSPNWQVWERQITTYPYSGTPGPPYDSLVQPYWVGDPTVTGNHAYQEAQYRINQRKVFAVSGDGHGVRQVWQDTDKAYIGLSVPAATYTSPVVCTDSLNTLYVGHDLVGTSGFGLFNGEISSVLVFNTVLTQTQVNAAYRAVRWLETEDKETVFVGDSLVASQPSATNDFPNFYASATGENCWRNIGAGGSKAVQFASQSFSSITNLPYPQKVKSLNVFYGFGINDVYADGASVATLLGYITNSAITLKSYGANFNFITIPTLWTANTVYTFTSAKEAVRNSVNLYMATNSIASRVFRRDLLVSQYTVDTNNLFSVDGLHFSGTRGPVMNMAIANLLLGNAPSASFMPEPFASGFVRTNFVSGQIYTNIYGRTISVSAKASLVVAAVSGSSLLSLEMPSNETNSALMVTTASSIAGTYTNVISGVITNMGTFTFTNRSSGAGNSATVTGGQILIY